MNTTTDSSAESTSTPESIPAADGKLHFRLGHFLPNNPRTVASMPMLMWLIGLGMTGTGLLLHIALASIIGGVVMAATPILSRAGATSTISAVLFATCAICASLGLGLLSTAFLLGYVLHNSTTLAGNRTPMVVR